MPDPSPEPMPDAAALLDAACRGDDGAWRSLLALYTPRVYAMARSRVGQRELAEEITQSVFVTVAQKLMTGKYADRGRFEAWLFRVTMNRVRDEFRRRKRRPAESLDGYEPATACEAPVDDDRGNAALRAALASLAERDRVVIELRHHGGLSFKHIAAVLDEPMGTVLARHYRALKKLKQLIESGETMDAAAKPRSVK